MSKSDLFITYFGILLWHISDSINFLSNYEPFRAIRVSIPSTLYYFIVLANFSIDFLMFWLHILY